MVNVMSKVRGKKVSDFAKDLKVNQDIVLRKPEEWDEEFENVDVCCGDEEQGETERPRRKVYKKVGVKRDSEMQTQINWDAILNKITLPRVIKGGTTLGAGWAGSVIGAGIATGIGFVVMGPGGAVMGQYVGELLGWAGGIYTGNRLGQMLSEQMEKDEVEDGVVFKEGKTNIHIKKRTMAYKEAKSRNKEER